jgi:uncharacterized protein (DUF1800 family)
MPSINPINTSATLGRKNAAHLLRRATFGPSKAEIDTFANYTITQALSVLLAPKAVPPPPNDMATGQPWVNPAPVEANSDEADLERMTLAWWMDLMVRSEPSLIDKMAWFHHTHFTTIRSRIRRGASIYYQIKLFRHYALGNFKSLAEKISLDNAMLKHLDGNLNEKGKPNENYGREFLELYTIGKGAQAGPDDYTTYTEQDVREAARVLSGYRPDYTYTNIDVESGVALGVLKGTGDIATRHDAGIKTFSVRFNNTVIQPTVLVDENATKDAALDELHQLVEMIFQQPDTARHICRKLYRFFVYYHITPEIEQQIIEPLSQTFIANDYELAPVLRQLFASQHFYDTDNGIGSDDNRGAIIKSPLELIVGSLRFFKVQMPDQTSSLYLFYRAYFDLIFKKMEDQGLDMYEPFEVAGYPAYHQSPVYNRNWITNNNLAQRYQFSTQLLLGKRDDDDNILYKAYVLPYCQSEGVDLNTPQAIVQYFVDYLLPEAISQERFDYFKAALLVEVPEADWKATVIDGEDFQVVFHLENLLNAMLQSPEYQLI